MSILIPFYKVLFLFIRFVQPPELISKASPTLLFKGNLLCNREEEEEEQKHLSVQSFYCWFCLKKNHRTFFKLEKGKKIINVIFKLCFTNIFNFTPFFL